MFQTFMLKNGENMISLLCLEFHHQEKIQT